VCRIFGDVAIRVRASAPAAADVVHMSIRPEHLHLGRTAPAGGTVNALSGRIAHAAYLGTHQRVGVRLESGIVIEVRLHQRQSFALDEPVSVWWSAEDGVLVDP
jgi:ABC-type Fe3+/spermidine/putrescine transport system ATPase subunit